MTARRYDVRRTGPVLCLIPLLAARDPHRLARTSFLSISLDNGFAGQGLSWLPRSPPEPHEQHKCWFMTIWHAEPFARLMTVGSGCHNGAVPFNNFILTVPGCHNGAQFRQLSHFPPNWQHCPDDLLLFSQQSRKWLAFTLKAVAFCLHLCEIKHTRRAHLFLFQSDGMNQAKTRIERKKRATNDVHPDLAQRTPLRRGQWSLTRSKKKLEASEFVQIRVLD